MEQEKTFATKKYVILAVVCVASAGICVAYIALGMRGENSDRQSAFDGPAAGNGRPQTGDPDPDKLISEEKELLKIVSSWKGPQTEAAMNWDEKQAYRAKVASAILRLGELKSARAIPLLVDRIGFGHLPKRWSNKVFWEDPPLTEWAAAMVALRRIGREAADEIVTRIGEIDQEENFLNLREVLLLRQALLGVVDRKEAVALLEGSARQATEDSVRDRLLLSARRVARQYICE